MAKTEIERAVQPSLLDRLTDQAPRELADHATTREASARAYRVSVQRDVEWLLNTRRTMVRTGDNFPQVARSVHQYGLPDTSGFALSLVAGRELLSDDILDTLRRFEPRLTNIQVKVNDTKEGRLPKLRFSIAATLLMDPSPELVLFDTILEVATGVYEVDDKT